MTYGYSVDCWALGVFLYTAACGLPPFEEDSNHMCANNAVPEIVCDEVWAQVYPLLQKVVRGCLVSPANMRFDICEVMQMCVAE